MDAGMKAECEDGELRMEDGQFSSPPSSIFHSPSSPFFRVHLRLNLHLGTVAIGFAAAAAVALAEIHAEKMPAVGRLPPVRKEIPDQCKKLAHIITANPRR
jgi:hypothetical protein